MDEGFDGRNRHDQRRDVVPGVGAGRVRVVRGHTLLPVEPVSEPAPATENLSHRCGHSGEEALRWVKVPEKISAALWPFSTSRLKISTTAIPVSACHPSCAGHLRLEARSTRKSALLHVFSLTPPASPNATRLEERLSLSEALSPMLVGK